MQSLSQSRIPIGVSDASKFIFAFLVFAFHFTIAFHGLAKGQGFGGSSFFISRADVAVSGFFFLSGFALNQRYSTVSGNILKLVLRRVARVVVPVVFALLLTWMFYNSGYGDIATNLSSMGYEWGFIVPIGMNSLGSFDDWIKMFSDLIFNGLDTVLLVMWFIPVLLCANVSLLLINKFIRPRVSGDLMFIIHLVVLAISLYQGGHKGLFACFWVGVMFSCYQDKFNTAIQACSRKMGNFFELSKIILIMLSFLIAYSLRLPDQFYIDLIKDGYSYIAFSITQRSYIFSLASALSIIYFCTLFAEDNKVIEFSRKYSSLIWPFLLINFTVFGVISKLILNYGDYVSIAILAPASIVISVVAAYLINGCSDAVMRFLHAK